MSSCIRKILFIVLCLFLTSCCSSAFMDVHAFNNELDISIENCSTGSKGFGQIVVGENEAIYVQHDLPKEGFVEILVVDSKNDKAIIKEFLDSYGTYMKKLNQGEYELYLTALEEIEGTINIYTDKNK